MQHRDLLLERIELEDFTESDMANLKKGLDADPALEYKVVLNKILSGSAVLLRYKTPRGETIFIIEENHDNKEKYIFIWYMGGTGIVGNVSYFIDAISEYGKLRDCKSVRSFSLPLIARYMKRFGFKPQMVAMRKEI